MARGALLAALPLAALAARNNNGLNRVPLMGWNTVRAGIVGSEGAQGAAERQRNERSGVHSAGDTQRAVRFSSAPRPPAHSLCAVTVPALSARPQWCTAGKCELDVCNEAEVKGAAQALLDSGLRDVGFHHVALDDCWADPQRDANGNLQPDPSRFPLGIAELAGWLHDRNLTFGIYTSLGYHTCVCVGARGWCCSVCRAAARAVRADAAA
jgi:hypothetical protein